MEKHKLKECGFEGCFYDDGVDGDMTMNSAVVRWFCNTIEMPLAHFIGKGDVRIYGREDIRELSKNAGLHMESFEKRGFCRLHCVVRKPE